ncbi:MAG: MvaI/BcnI restriction endonuclease family protein [Bacilli bacterium]|nr:MvaI/BcnI restriction endonuclease family protein [Bacilli bacterium]
MDENCKNLLEEFKTISKKRWIKGINNFTNSAGLTFETLLDKKADSLYFPDYQGIEIKCTQRFSRYPITLFSSAFDGPSLYEMNEILNKYGKSDFIYKDKKQLNATLNCNKKVLVNNKYYFKLEISDEEQKLYLSVYDIMNNLIEKSSFINFETLKNRLELKLSTLALVFASKKTIDNCPYFRYYKIIFYKFISFEKFIELLKQDIIIVDIVGRVSRSGIEAGRQRNKNLVFQINKENVTKLFKVIKIYDNDLEDSYFQII